MLARPTEKIGKICTATSTDGGMTWSEIRPIDMPNPNSAMDAVRLDDGRIVLVHNPTVKGRHQLSVSVSKDGGLTWKTAFDLMHEPGKEHSYPAMILDSKGKLQISWAWNKENIGYAVVDPTKF
jgi:predicted neuraminidase